MADMLVLVPTRGRPANVRRLIAACLDTGATSQFLLIADDDDSQTRELLAAGLPDRWDFSVGPADCLSGKLNYGAGVYGKNYFDVIAFLADDAIPVTPGWDKALAEAAAADGGGWAYPAGGREDVPEHVAISAGIVAALGWFACPALSHYWIDNVWADLGRATGRLRYLPDVEVMHLHGPHDATRAAAEAHGQADAVAYATWRAGQHHTFDVATLRQLSGA